MNNIILATFLNYCGWIVEDLYYESSERYQLQLGPSESVWIKFISFSRTFSWNKGSRPFFGRNVFLLDANTRQISGINKWRFLLQCLDDLDQGLRRLQSRLYVVRGQPLDALPNLIKRMYFSIYASHHLELLKVSKSQKHFFLKIHCPKNERNIWQNSTLWS